MSNDSEKAAFHTWTIFNCKLRKESLGRKRKHAHQSGDGEHHIVTSVTWWPNIYNSSEVWGFLLLCFISAANSVSESLEESAAAYTKATAKKCILEKVDVKTGEESESNVLQV